MALVVAAFTAALLSALAFVPAEPTARRRWLPFALAGVACALGVALWSGALDAAYVRAATAQRATLDPGPARAAAHAAGLDLAWRALLVMAALGALRAWHARRPWRAAGAVLVGLLVLDLLAVTLPTLRRATAPATVMRHPETPRLATIGAQHPEERVLSLRTYDVSRWQVAGSDRSAELRINDWIRWRAKAYGGEHGTPPVTWSGLELLASVNAWRAVGITYVNNVPAAPLDTATAEVVASGPTEVIYRLRGALGRAYAVPRVTPVDEPASFARLINLGFDPAREAITTDAAATGEYPGSAACAIRWRRDEPDSLALDIEAPGRAFVVVADSYFPGWGATLDGAPVPIHRVNHMLRGVAVPAGSHRLAMTFTPEGWRAALPVTRVAMVAWVLAAIAWAGLVVRGIGRGRAAA
jgi:hypothetical protein